MPEFSTCEKCGFYDFSEEHKCPPLYTVYDEYGKKHEIYAFSPSEAAQKWGKKYEEKQNGEIEDNYETIISVKDHYTNEVIKYKLYAEKTINFLTEEIGKIDL